MEKNNQKTKNEKGRIDEASVMRAISVTSSNNQYSGEIEEQTERSLETEISGSEQTSDETLSEKEEKREVRRKKLPSGTYETLFIRSANIKAKTGKTIYLRPEYHRRISRILQLPEDSPISLTDYIDNVFTHHFQLFEQDIREFCLKNNDPII